MPRWLANRTRRSPLLEEGQGPSGAPARNPFLQCEGDEFLRNAIPVSGAGHMIHNSVRGFVEALKHFPAFFLQLKVVEMALGHPGRCERICATCLQGTAFSKRIDSFKKFSFTLHEMRWTAVAAFCAATTSLLAVLRRCFSASAYLQRGRGELVERDWEKADGRKFGARDFLTNTQELFVPALPRDDHKASRNPWSSPSLVRRLPVPRRSVQISQDHARTGESTPRGWISRRQVRLLNLPRVRSRRRKIGRGH